MGVRLVMQPGLANRMSEWDDREQVWERVRLCCTSDIFGIY